MQSAETLLKHDVLECEMLKVFKRYVFRCNIEKSSIEGPDEKSAKAGTRGRQPPSFIGTSRRILTDTHSKHSKERTPNITPKLQARSELQAASLDFTEGFSKNRGANGRFSKILRKSLCVG